MITVRAIANMAPGDVLVESGITVQRTSAQRWLVAVGDAPAKRANSAKRAMDIVWMALPMEAIARAADGAA